MSWISSAISGVTSLFGSGGVGGASWGSLIGGGLSAYGSYASGKAASTAANQQATAAINEGKFKQIDYEFQAGQAEQNAAQVLLEAGQQMFVTKQQGIKAVSSIGAQYAGSGVVSGVGSAGVVEARTWSDVMQDISMINQSAQSQATNYRNQAGALRRAGTQAVEAGNITANALRTSGSSSSTQGLLGAAASLAKIWA